MRIETRRLLLRPLEQADFSALQKILGDPRVMYAWEHGFGDAEVRDWMDLLTNSFPIYPLVRTYRKKDALRRR